MKKNNKTLRVAAVLAVGALLSTCLVSGTFAKYVTSGGSSDVARVAKFGVEVTGQKTMFSEKYGENVVSSETGKKVVAPGTEGTLNANDISGTPEVTVRVDNAATVTLTGWADENGEYYCPLEVTVGNGTPIKGSTYGSITDFKKAIEDAVAATSNTYKPGKAITSAGTNVSWKWDFDGNEDVKDTYLGKQATENNASTIAVGVATTVTQVK